jgi:hypothetical protein
MYLFDHMSLWDKIRLLLKIYWLKHGFLKYQTIEIYDAVTAELDIRRNPVFCFVSSNVFYIRDKDGNIKRSKSKSFKAWKEDGKKGTIRYDPNYIDWSRSTNEERQAYVDHRLAEKRRKRLKAPAYGIDKVVLAGGQAVETPGGLITISGMPQPTEEHYPVSWSKSMSDIVRSQRKEEERKKAKKRT